MHRVTTPGGTVVSYDRCGGGPPLVLVHGAFSDHETNWGFVRPLFERRFTVYAVARRGRGETEATGGHSVEDEGRDVVAVIRSVGDAAFQRVEEELDWAELGWAQLNRTGRRTDGEA